MDAPETDLELGLADFLGNDLGGGVRIQEAVTQDLAGHLVGAAVIGFRAGLMRQEGRQATLLEVVEQLIIALTTVAVFVGDGGDVLFQALAFDEHEEAVSLKVGGRYRQGAGGANQTMGFGVKLEDGSAHGESIVRSGRNV